MIVVPAGQQRPAQRLEDALVGAAEMVLEDQLQRGTGLRLVVVVPIGVVPAAAAGHLVRRQPEQRKFSSPAASAISIVAPSRVPMVRAPFIMNFMLLVPLAS